MVSPFLPYPAITRYMPMSGCGTIKVYQQTAGGPSVSSKVYSCGQGKKSKAFLSQDPETAETFSHSCFQR